MMARIPVWRMWLLRAGYLLLVVGLGVTIWPEILDPGQHWEASRGIVVCMLGAMSALSVIGLWRPLEMLPVLFFEIAWKVLWLLRVALPAWWAGRMDAAIAANVFACSLVILIVAVVPWRECFGKEAVLF